MDTLLNEDKAQSWDAVWNTSFVGFAKIRDDFIVESVNKQLCEILSITEAEIVNMRIQDVIPSQMRKLMEANATLMKQGIMDSFATEMSLDFGEDRTKPVVFLLNRVPKTYQGDFRFYILQIMLDAESPMVPEIIPQEHSEWQSSTPSEPSMQSTDFIERIKSIFLQYWQYGVMIGGSMFYFYDVVTR